MRAPLRSVGSAPRRTELWVRRCRAGEGGKVVVKAAARLGATRPIATRSAGIGPRRGREAEVEGLDGEGLAGPGPGFSNHVLSSEGATAVVADDDIEWCGGAPPSPGWVHVLPWLSV